MSKKNASPPYCIVLTDSPIKDAFIVERQSNRPETIIISDSPVKEVPSKQHDRQTKSEEMVEPFIIPESPLKVEWKSGSSTSLSKKDDMYGSLPESDQSESESEEEDIDYASSSDSEAPADKQTQCLDCQKFFSSVGNRNKHMSRKQCKTVSRKRGLKTTSVYVPVDMKRRKLSPSLWVGYEKTEVEVLPFDIDGTCSYRMKYDKDALMKSSQDGRPWKKWVSSSRAGFNGVRRLATCSGTHQCNNTRCPYIHSYFKPNKVNFQSQGTNHITCSCCGYKALKVDCTAKKVWEFQESYVTIYHYGKHTCVAKKRTLKSMRTQVHFSRSMQVLSLPSTPMLVSS
ncbi:uncharacterized protein LOC116308074 [Actinia tenebrosa]|uniref:Uncharacterized protein LOC116308074 n=1 Tax=Actinia tenebrosa TaxID=6105 RepID=A0A6P8J3W4_ACTTE|nr:uncharacterized protein LOC116308074 [Actinia tenebrosa]